MSNATQRNAKRMAKIQDQTFADMKWDEKTAEQKEDTWKSASEYNKQIIRNRISSEEDKLKYIALAQTAVRADFHRERMIDVPRELRRMFLYSHLYC